MLSNYLQDPWKFSTWKCWQGKSEFIKTDQIIEESNLDERKDNCEIKLTWKKFGNNFIIDFEQKNEALIFFGQKF